ncbi:hypothetical protein D3C71_1035270 [compost metagenome]
MHRTQQRVGHRLRRHAGLAQPGLQGRLVGVHLGFEDLAQYFVDVGRGATGLDNRGGGHGVDGVRGVDRGGNRRGGALQRHVEGFLAGGDAVCDGLHGLQVGADPAFATQRGVELRQHVVGLGDHGHHGRRGRAGAVEHAVEHALDLPAELAQGTRADQAAAALEGMEHAADRAQPVHAVRRGAPDRQQIAEVDQLLVELFDEDLADVLVDVLGIVLEAGLDAVGGVLRHRCRLRRRGSCGRLRLGAELRGGGIQLGQEAGRLVVQLDLADHRRMHAGAAVGHDRRRILGLLVGRVGGLCRGVLERRSGLDRLDRLDCLDVLDVLDPGGVMVRHRRCRLRRLELFHVERCVLDRRAVVVIVHGQPVRAGQRGVLRRRGIGSLQEARQLLDVQRGGGRRHVIDLQRQHVAGIVQRRIEGEFDRRIADLQHLVFGGHRVEPAAKRDRCGLVRGRLDVVIGIGPGRLQGVQCHVHRRHRVPAGGGAVFGDHRIEVGKATGGGIALGRVGQRPLRGIRCAGGGGGKHQGGRIGGRGGGRWRIEGEVRQRRRHAARGRRGRGHGGLDPLGCRRFPRRQLDRFRCHRQRFGADVGDGRVRIGQRPVAQGFQAGPGDVEDFLAAGATFA